MKKKKLSLGKETFRTLGNNQLPRAVGGMPVTFGASCYTCNGCQISREIICELK